MSGVLCIYVCCQHAEERKQRRYIVAERGLDDEGIFFGIAVKQRIAGVGLPGHVIGSLIADLRLPTEFLMSVAGDMDNNEPGIYLQKLLIVNA